MVAIYEADIDRNGTTKADGAPWMSRKVSANGFDQAFRKIKATLRKQERIRQIVILACADK